MSIQKRSPVLHLPSTKLGRLAVGLAATFVVTMIIGAYLLERIATWEIYENIWQAWQIFYFFAPAALIVGLIAVIEKRERSWLVWLIILASIAGLCLAIYWYFFNV